MTTNIANHQGNTTVRYFIYFSTLCITAALALPALAETPNLKPGLWSYKSTSTMEGPMNVPPQTSNNQECLTQSQLDKGINVLNIPKSCDVTQTDITRERVDFAANCNVEGMTTVFKGYATFHGTHLEGKMTSEMNTPIGPMIMKTDYKAERVGDCQGK